MKRSLSTLAVTGALALVLGSTAMAHADIVTFDGFGSTTQQPASFDLEGLNFTTSVIHYIWPGYGPGADNGTDHLIYGYGAETISLTGGGPFTLNSFDLGLSYYTQPTDTVSFTFNYAAGGSSTVVEPVGQFYTSYTENLPPLSSVVFSNPLAGDGYVAVDNIVFNASSVPEPGTYALLGSLGLTGAAFLRRRRAR